MQWELSLEMRLATLWVWQKGKPSVTMWVLPWAWLTVRPWVLMLD